MSVIFLLQIRKKKIKKNGSYIFQNLDKFENPKIIREKNDLITNLWQTKPQLRKKQKIMTLILFNRFFII